MVKSIRECSIDVGFIQLYVVFTTDTDPGGPIPTLDLVVTVERTPGGEVGALTVSPPARATRLDDLVGWLQGGFQLWLWGRGHDSWGWGTSLSHQVSGIVADEWGVVTEMKASLDGQEQVPDHVTVGWDLDLYALVVLAVDDGVGFSAFQVDVFDDLAGETVALLAEGDVLVVRFVGESAAGAVVCVAGEGAHDEELVVPWSAGEDGLWVEVDLPDDGRHGGR